MESGKVDASYSSMALSWAVILGKDCFTPIIRVCVVMAASDEQLNFTANRKRWVPQSRLRAVNDSVAAAMW